MSTQKKFPRFVAKEKSLFFPTLQKRVNDYFKDNNISKYANAKMVIKTIVLLSAFAFPLLAVILFPLRPLTVITLFFIMGVALAGIGMGIMHDANHDAYSRNKNVNKWLGYSLNLIGGMVFNWKIQHNVLHHTYTNVHEADDDIENKLILRFSPHSPPKKIHRFQFIYVFFFYGILTLYWAVLKDFVQYIKYRKNGVNRSGEAEYKQTLWSMIALKLIYFFYMIALPIIMQGYSFGLIIACFVMMHFVSGLILGVVFQLAHSIEEASFPLPNENNIVENDWAIHQMNTTANFARENKLITWYVGGLNYQVEHHLFPHVCHVHYPELSKMVEQTAKEFGVPYLCAPSFSKALGSHLRMLKKFGYDFNLDLATM